ncbi:MAG: glycosyl hydrolase [Anaerolineae bacterium]|nr:glycosyl hydrolase [Anaerolineae bacterium]
MSHLMFLGTRKGLLIYEQEKSGAWLPRQEVFRGAPVSYAALDPRTGVLWAALDYGHWGTKLQRSDDLGATWREVSAPAYPEGAVRADGEPATLSYIWIVAPGGADQPDRLYVGTEPGGLFVSDDGGESFTLLDPLWNHPTRADGWSGGGRDQPGVCSVVVDPRDSNHLFVGISVGGVYESTDGGQTWHVRNRGLYADYLPDPHAEVGHDPHFMLASPSNPDVLWQQNHCGIFRSTDAACNWTDISDANGPAGFGFALALDAADAQTAWVVPAISAEYRVPVDGALCVCRTDDGGQTWQAFRAGLPQQDCYDIAFRHALDVDGDRLAFGTTSGNVYLSDDRGESWQNLAQNLAVVYSVRFAKF